MKTILHSGRAGLVVIASALLALGWFCWNIARFFPNAAGRMGYDYGLFMPWFTAGRFWEAVNGPWLPPEYLPSFCGGTPFLFNPQSVYWSLPQALMLVMPPMPALVVSWIVFGLAGGIGMIGLLRRAYGVSPEAALAGGVLFALNGFYTTRMIIGHVTFHGVMLLPAIAWLLLAPVAVQGWRRIPAIIARGCGCGLLLAYLFASGGTNTILPMMLALAVLGLLAIHLGRWHRAVLPIAVVAFALFLAMSAYKLLPALAFAGNVTRPVALRMTGNLVALVGAAAVSLFAPQVLAYIPPEKLVLDRVEFEYGVGIVPLLAIGAALFVAWRRRDLATPFAGRRWLTVLAMAMLLVLPILVNWDGPGMRALVLHLPVVKMMSVLVRFWFAYVPLLCVLTALLIDYLVPTGTARRSLLAAGAIVLTLGQAALTDMTRYETQAYDPAPLIAAQARLAAGEPVPAVARIADPWEIDGAIQPDDAGRNAAFVDGTSPFPCYEPMFGYRMEVFPPGRLMSGPVMEERGGLLNLRNPACYVFPAENSCRPGAEFRSSQRAEAEAFRSYRPFGARAPHRQALAAQASWSALILSLLGLTLGLVLSLPGRRRDA